MKLLISLILVLPLYGDMPFKIGEELNYNASFGSIDAARGSLKVLKKELELPSMYFGMNLMKES